MKIEMMIKTKSRTAPEAMITTLNARGLVGFFTLIRHGGSFNSSIPPQSLLFPRIDMVRAFPKAPFFGTLPSSSLKERFRYSK
ncbi:hypothetical protein LguiB_021179 [Lonicera macranthoides]